MSGTNIEGAPHWRLCTSRRTGKQYFFNWHNNTSLWVCKAEDPLGKAPAGGAGWGYLRAVDGSPSRAINIFSNETRQAEGILAAVQKGKTPAPEIPIPGRGSMPPRAGSKRGRPDLDASQTSSGSTGAARTEGMSHPRGSSSASAPGAAKASATGEAKSRGGQVTKFGREPPDTPLPKLPIEWYRRGWPDDKNAAVELAARNAKLRERGVLSSSSTTGAARGEGSTSVPAGSTGSELSAMASPYTGVKPPPDLSSDDRVFGAAHRRVLQQVLAASPRQTILDVGAGTGQSTAFILEICPKAQVFAIDLWHSPFAGDQLRAHGHADLGSALGAAPRAYEAFCLQLDDQAGAASAALATLTAAEDSSGAVGGGATGAPTGLSSSSSSSSSSAGGGLTIRQRLIPMRYPMHAAMRHLRSIGMQPDVVYLDADLDHGKLKDVLLFVLQNFPRAHVVGGGWALSAGVRRAVCEVVVEQGRLLHVEQGLCWTFSPPLVRQTANKPEDATRLASLLGSEAKGTHTAALTAVNFVMRTEAILSQGDGVDELRKLCEGRGRSAEDSLRFRDRTEPGPVPGEPDSVYIDTSGNDKRCYTPLMRAINHRRPGCAAFLLREVGARVNVQAPRSLQTALHLAAYKGDRGLIDMLLAAGASRVLKNKWGETPAITAVKGGKHELAALLKPVGS